MRYHAKDDAREASPLAVFYLPRAFRRACLQVIEDVNTNIQMMFASVSAIGQSGKCYIIELHVQCMQIKEELILLI